MCVALMYGSGLRILECVSLRVKDVDLDRRIQHPAVGSVGESSPYAEDEIEAPLPAVPDRIERALLLVARREILQRA